MHSVYNIKVLLEHSNSRTFKGLEFFFKIQGLSGLLRDPMNRVTKLTNQTAEIKNSLTNVHVSNDTDAQVSSSEVMPSQEIFQMHR